MKTVRVTKKQKRPSASYYYNVLGKKVGFKTSYRPRKGGKYILHDITLRKNGTPFWKALEKLPKKQRSKGRKGRKSKKSRTTRRNSRGQQVRTRRARYLNRRGN